MELTEMKSLYFVGVAGSGMSAIAQYMAGQGVSVSGSDRYFSAEEKSPIQQQLEAAGIRCFRQDGSGMERTLDAVVVSTAIEESNLEYQKAVQLGLPIIKRSELLAHIANSRPTIAVGGTSGKSTTTAMIFHILQQCGKDPSLITGAGLVSLQKQGYIGNAWVGKGEYLVIEADESDGSIVGYRPQIALLLNMERDHKEMSELLELFGTFRRHTSKAFIVNQDNKMARSLSQNQAHDFSTGNREAGFYGSCFKQQGFSISFKVNGIPCHLPMIGHHNMENALAALSACFQTGISLEQGIATLASFEGIYRRTQLIGHHTERDIYVIDDFAHNPSEVAGAIRACQAIAPTVVAYFQPHGFGPLRFMWRELADETAQALRPSDCMIVGDVYYAGGTVNKDICSDVVSQAISQQGKTAYYGAAKEVSEQVILQQASSHSVVLIMGARDPNLTDWANKIFQLL